MSDVGHVAPELFQFLAELKFNNDRNWFNANKQRYEDHVKNPLLEFIAEFGGYLEHISPHFIADARPSGGSMFRIYRDVRFSKDKSPYKTAAAVQFRHERGKDVHAPGFYLHLEPGAVFAGVGLWHPDSGSLKKIRDTIVARQGRWEHATSNEEFASMFELTGESLKRPPKGYDPEHPLIEDLKRKDFIATTHFSEETAFEVDFIDTFADACRRTAPLMEFLTEAVGLKF